MTSVWFSLAPAIRKSNRLFGKFLRLRDTRRFVSAVQHDFVTPDQ
jgi:hypothetical protein